MSLGFEQDQCLVCEGRHQIDLGAYQCLLGACWYLLGAYWYSLVLTGIIRVLLVLTRCALGVYGSYWMLIGAYS